MPVLLVFSKLSLSLWQKDPGEWGGRGSAFFFFLLNCIAASLFICHYIIWKKRKLNCGNLSAACIILLSLYIWSQYYWAWGPAAWFVGLVSEAVEQTDLSGQQDGPVHPTSAQSSGGDPALVVRGCPSNISNSND